MRATGVRPRPTVVIDVPRGSFLKRSDDGSVDFVSPVPAPFNYGHIPGTLADDGEGIDAVVLGPRLQRGTTLTISVQERIGFLDAGVSDPKWVCSPRPLNDAERRYVERFFRHYALAKRLINWVRGRKGPTRYLGWL
jgi:inorganic pyrophosphatase